jgi:hypothetical protein
MAYKTRCDQHPDRPAKFAFTDAKTGQARGDCAECHETAAKKAAR